MLNELTIKKAVEGLGKKDFSSVELTQACLNRIDGRNDAINAFISVDEDLAMREAKDADKKISKGDKDLLLGVPFGVKDAICVKDVR